MNRENKRKQLETGYYKTHGCKDSFTCKVCGRLVAPEGAVCAVISCIVGFVAALVLHGGV